MAKLFKFPMNGVPRLAVSLADRVPVSRIKALQKARIDLIELRVDRFRSFDAAYVLAELKKYAAFPVLVTIRSKKEGGSWKGTEAGRLALYQAVLPSAAAIDVELSSAAILKKVVASARLAKKPVIVSSHDFKKTPSSADLNRLFDRSKAAGATIVKVAGFAKTDGDTFALADFTFKNRSKGVIGIAMGEKGTISRLLFPALGSLVTFASLGKPGAPGQMDWKTMARSLRELYPKYRSRAGRA